MHRQQLHRGDAKLLQVSNARLMGKPGIRSLQLVRNVWVPHREAAHVHFIDHRLCNWNLWRAIIFPVELVADHDAKWHKGGVIRIVFFGIVARHHVVGINWPAMIGFPGDCLRIGVQQNFRRVEAVAVRRIPRSVHAIPIPLARLNVPNESVPYKRGPLLQSYGFNLLMVFIKETKINGRRIFGIQSEVCSHGARRRSQRVGLSGQKCVRHGSSMMVV